MSSRDYEEGRLHREQRAEPIAKEFYEVYTRLAPQYGYEVNGRSTEAWETAPDETKQLMRAVVNSLIDSRTIVPWTAMQRVQNHNQNIRNCWKDLKELLE